jgi:hypothetical protein
MYVIPESIKVAYSCAKRIAFSKQNSYLDLNSFRSTPQKAQFRRTAFSLGDDYNNDPGC